MIFLKTETIVLYSLSYQMRRVNRKTVAWEFNAAFLNEYDTISSSAIVLVSADAATRGRDIIARFRDLSTAFFEAKIGNEPIEWQAGAAAVSASNNAVHLLVLTATIHWGASTSSTYWIVDNTKSTTYHVLHNRLNPNHQPYAKNPKI